METAKVNRPVNVRRPEVMAQVAEDLAHFQSTLVESLRQQGNELELPGVRLFLAESFGFCYGVKRAIEIAYAACRLFKGRRIWLIGEIIHNPDVNARLDALGLLHLPWKMDDPAYDALTADQKALVPQATLDKLTAAEAQIKAIEESIAGLDKRVLDYMTEHNLESLEGNGGVFKVKKAYERTSIDTGRLKKMQPGIYEQYKKTSTVAASLSFNINK